MSSAINNQKQSLTVDNDCWSYLPQLPSLTDGAVNNRPTAVAVYRTRWRWTRRDKIFKVQSLDKSYGRKYPVFEGTLISLKSKAEENL